MAHHDAGVWFWFIAAGALGPVNAMFNLLRLWPRIARDELEWEGALRFSSRFAIAVALPCLSLGILQFGAGSDWPMFNAWPTPYRLAACTLLTGFLSLLFVWVWFRSGHDTLSTYLPIGIFSKASGRYSVLWRLMTAVWLICAAILSSRFCLLD